MVADDMMYPYIWILQSRCRTAIGPASGQLADAQPAELDRRTFRLQAEEARSRLAAVAAGDFLAVDPQPDLAVDAADVVVVPLANALAQLFRREAAAAVGRDRRERGHLRGADREDVAVGREPGRPSCRAVSRIVPCSRGRGSGPRCRPAAAVPGLIPSSAFSAAQTKIPELPPERRCRHWATSSKLVTGLPGPDHADRLAGAVNDAVFPGPGLGVAVDGGEVVLAQGFPAGAGAVQKGPGSGCRLIGLSRDIRHGEIEYRAKGEHEESKRRGFHGGTPVGGRRGLCDSS